MPKLLTCWKALLQRDGGVTSIEYALIGSLVAMTIIGAVVTLGESVQSLYEMIAAKIPQVP